MQPGWGKPTQSLTSLRLGERGKPDRAGAQTQKCTKFSTPPTRATRPERTKREH